MRRIVIGQVNGPMAVQGFGPALVAHGHRDRRSGRSMTGKINNIRPIAAGSPGNIFTAFKIHQESVAAGMSVILDHDAVAATAMA